MLYLNNSDRYFLQFLLNIRQSVSAYKLKQIKNEINSEFQI